MGKNNYDWEEREWNRLYCQHGNKKGSCKKCKGKK